MSDWLAVCTVAKWRGKYLHLRDIMKERFVYKDFSFFFTAAVNYISKIYSKRKRLKQLTIIRSIIYLH